VPVHRAKVLKTQLFEERAGHHHAFDMLFGALGEFAHGRWHALDDLLGLFAQVAVDPAREKTGEGLVECADVLRDGHLVVVEYDEQIRAHVTGVVEALEGLPGGQPPVTDDRAGLMPVAAVAACQRHAQRRADRGT